MAVEISFTGGRELELALRGLGNEIAGRLGQNAVRAGARVIATSAKNRVPVRTGELRNSINIFDDVTSRRAGGRERTTYIGSRLFYAYWVEFGTLRNSPRSFLRTAVDYQANEAVDRLAQNLGQGIEREAAKYAGRGR